MAEETPTAPAAPPLPAASPTGAPVLPPKVAPYALYVATVAVALSMAPDIGLALPAAVLGLAKFVTLLASLFGIVSPGWRK